MPLYIAAKQLKNGTTVIPAGSLMPEAEHWRRRDVAISRGDIIVLGDDVIAAIASIVRDDLETEPEPAPVRSTNPRGSSARRETP